VTTISPDGSSEAKAALRRRLRDARGTLSPSTLAAAGTALAAHAPTLARPVVALFVAAGQEPPTLPLIDALSDLGVQVLLPVLEEDMDLDWGLYAGPGSLLVGRRGILVPAGPRLGREAVGAAGLVLVPALGVGRDGTRLGQGGGSYDRALARAVAPAIAIVHDDEVLEVVPVEAHDRRVHGFLTPSEGVVLVDGPGEAS
jgi:5-formyltetrahydrofolate cyclo-ligase